MLRRVTGLSFEQILMGQQFVYRAVAILGLYLLAIATGLRPLLAWLAAALISLGASVIGPAVLIVEYEPVPRGFALPFVVFSLAMVAHRRWSLAAAAGTIAFSFHPPTALAYCGVLACSASLEQRVQGLGCAGDWTVVDGWSRFWFRRRRQISCLCSGASIPHWKICSGCGQRITGSSLWLGRWIYLYVVLTTVGFLAWLRIRRFFSRELNVLILALPAIGLLSIPLSYVLLERMKLMFVPQLQPGRYLLYVTFFAILLASIAAIHAAERGSYVESALFFLVPLGDGRHGMGYDEASRNAIGCGWPVLAIALCLVRKAATILANRHRGTSTFLCPPLVGSPKLRPNS